jgi:phosphoribosylglycinamide formyltransferase 1
LQTLGVVLSGRGSNFTAILAQIRQGLIHGVHIGCVISNHVNAAGLAAARRAGLPALSLPAFKRRADRDTYLLYLLRRYNVTWVTLAGYDRIVGDPLLTAYAGRILNIHPSLLPQYGGKGMVGMAVHQAVLAAGEAETGCTVHQVTAEVDGGAILGQTRVPVESGDTPDTLAARVLAQEHVLYSQVIRDVCKA